MTVVHQQAYRFVCNGCGALSDVQWLGLEYTPPPGWTATERERLEHRCPACAAKEGKP